MHPPSELDRLDSVGRIYWPSKAGSWPYLKLFLDESRGVPLQDVWTDIDPVNPVAKERLGYPTQKPLALLERIISASSNPGDVVLDPFCGCGTAVVAAEKLGRRWIGIDITHLAVQLMADRLRGHFPGIEFDVRGRPTDISGARELARQDKHQFEWWALTLVGADPPIREGRKGSDRGIDGVITFEHRYSQRIERILVQVKGGKTGVKDIRDLAWVIERENAAMGVFITLDPPTSHMERESRESGVWQASPSSEAYQRVQIVTIENLLDKTDELRLPILRHQTPYRPPKISRWSKLPQQKRLEYAAANDANLGTS